MGKGNGSNGFSSKLRTELVKQNLGVRTLARRMDPGQPERARRSLNRWLNEGIKPSPANRVAVALALGVPEDSFADDDDEEEDAELYAALSQLTRVIVSRVKEEAAA